MRIGDEIEEGLEFCGVALFIELIIEGAFFGGFSLFVFQLYQ